MNNHPNPFNGSTQISYELSAPSQVHLTIYNIVGQVVATLVNEYQQAGIYQVTWDGRNDRGNRVVSGVYLYRLQAEGLDAVERTTLLQ